MTCRDLEVREAPNVIDALGLSDSDVREVLGFVLRVLAKADDGGGKGAHLAEIYRRYCGEPAKLLFGLMMYQHVLDNPDILMTLLLAKAVGGGALDEFIRKFADAVLAAKRSVNNEVLAV